MDKFFSQFFWRIFRVSIKKSEIIALILSAMISFLIFSIVEKYKSGDYWGISIESWRAVASSIFAASLFLFIQWIIDQLKSSENNLYKNKYEEVIDKNGIKHVYYQRGGEKIISIYKELIKNSKKRVWAIGMTNNHFCEQHFKNVLDLMEVRRGDFTSGKHIDFIISFWDANICFFDCNKQVSTHNILELQTFIEKGSFPRSSWSKMIGDKQQDLIRKIESRKKINGNFKIINLSIPTNFTCFIIDDDVFFFPYLSGPDSTTDPTIHCDANKGIGLSIVNHIQKITSTKEVVEVVYQKNTI